MIYYFGCLKQNYSRRILVKERGGGKSSFTLWYPNYFIPRPELVRPATTLYQHNLTGILETAVRATNAQFDNAEILKRLDVRLLEVMCVRMCVLRRGGWGGEGSSACLLLFDICSAGSRCLLVIQAGMFSVWTTTLTDPLLRYYTRTFNTAPNILCVFLCQQNYI